MPQVDVLYRLNTEHPEKLKTLKAIDKIQEEMLVPNKTSLEQLQGQKHVKTKEIEGVTVIWSDDFFEVYAMRKVESRFRTGRRISGGETLQAVIGDVAYLTNETKKDMSEVQLTVRGKELSTVHIETSKHIPFLRMRRMFTEQPKYSVQSGKPALRAAGRTFKTGKYLRRCMPHLDDKELQAIALQVDKMNPAMAYEEALENFVFGNLEFADKAVRGSDSCMWQRGHWQKMQPLLFDPATEIPDGNVPWPDGSGPMSIIWHNPPQECKTAGRGEKQSLRAFLWPVEMPNGDRRWYLDRVYPSKPESRKFCDTWADAHGFFSNGKNYSQTGAGACTDRAAAQLPMIHRLKAPFKATHKSLPWLDTFVRISVDGMAVCTMAHAESGLAGLMHSSGYSVKKEYLGNKCAARLCKKDAKYVDARQEYYCEKHGVKNESIAKKIKQAEAESRSV